MSVDYGMYTTKGKRMLLAIRAMVNGRKAVAYQSCGWDRTRSYRLPGVEYPQQRLVNYDLCRAIPIFEGKVDKENESAQEPVQATSGAENI